MRHLCFQNLRILSVSTCFNSFRRPPESPLESPSHCHRNFSFEPPEERRSERCFRFRTEHVKTSDIPEIKPPCNMDVLHRKSRSRDFFQAVSVFLHEAHEKCTGYISCPKITWYLHDPTCTYSPGPFGSLQV